MRAVEAGVGTREMMPDDDPIPPAVVRHTSSLVASATRETMCARTDASRFRGPPPRDATGGRDGRSDHAASTSN